VECAFQVPVRKSSGASGSDDGDGAWVVVWAVATIAVTRRVRVRRWRMRTG
jgi:hypothetical protein